MTDKETTFEVTIPCVTTVNGEERHFDLTFKGPVTKKILKHLLGNENEDTNTET